MALVRRIARPLLAAPFIFEGVRTALHPEREIDVYPQAFDAVDSALGKTSPGFVDVRGRAGAGAIAAGAGSSTPPTATPAPPRRRCWSPRPSAGRAARRSGSCAARS